ncbi:GTPase [Bacteroidota bacterium]
MPTNLPPEYFDAERRYKEAKNIKEKAECLEELLSTIPKHKGTDKLRADYRKRLSKLKSTVQTKKKTGKHESQFHIEKEGDGRIVVVGAANVGKSSLVKTVTHATPEISDIPYTTWIPTPGMLNFENIHLQLIDTPALDRDYIEPELIDIIKNSDLIILMLDLQAYPIQQFQNCFEFLTEHRIVPSHKKEQYPDKRNIQIPILIVVNKDDGKNLDEEFDVLSELLEDDNWSILPISVKTKRNFDLLMKNIIKEMDIIRVYSKPPGKDVDKTQPFVLKNGSSVGDFANKVHRDFYYRLKTARLWGSGAYDGQMVSKDHILKDGDVVELHM